MSTEPRRYAPPIQATDAVPELARVVGLPYRERRRALRVLFEAKYPRFLYRYTAPRDERSIERLRDVVVASELWLSSPRDFNDPFDMTAALDFTGTTEQKRAHILARLERYHAEVPESLRRQRAEEILADESQLREILDGSFHNNMAKVGVVCFTRDPRNILMWSHYADHHRGVVLQFEPSHDVLELGSAIEVHYEEKYPILRWFQGFELDIGMALLHKHNGWCYEREFRCLRVGHAHTRVRFAPQALRAIILGCRADERIESTVRGLLAERAARGAPALSLYRAEKHTHEYRLVLRRLEL